MHLMTATMVLLFIFLQFTHRSHFIVYLFFFIVRQPPRYTLFPYTTLFRSYVFLNGYTDEDAFDFYFQDWNEFYREWSNSSTLVPLENFAIEFVRSEEHTSELQSRRDLVCRLLLEKKKR